MSEVLVRTINMALILIILLGHIKLYLDTTKSSQFDTVSSVKASGIPYYVYGTFVRYVEI